jgi:hypothetical protein
MADDPKGMDAKLAEFRDNNIALLKELNELKVRFEGIEPDAVKNERAELAALRAAKPDAALQKQLDDERAAHAATRTKADAVVIENKLSDALARAGVRPQARAFVLAQAAGLFTLENGELKATKRSPARPGELMSVDEWVTQQTKENAYAFLPSSGGGADPRRGGGPGGTVLKNPSAQQLGQYATEIASGAMRIEND